MNASHSGRALLAAMCAALVALTLAASGAAAAEVGIAARLRAPVAPRS